MWQSWIVNTFKWMREYHLFRWCICILLMLLISEKYGYIAEGWIIDNVWEFISIEWNWISQLLYCLLTIALGYRIYVCYKNEYELAGWQNFLIACSVYLYIRFRIGHDDLYEHVIWYIAYIDIFCFEAVLVLCLVPFSFYLSRKRSKNNIISEKPLYLYDDTPIKKESEDLLGYADDAKEKANKIRLLSKKRCWSIAISAPWGNGKTSYMNLLNNALSKDENIVLYFNPRQSAGPHTIQQDFFDLLLSELGRYDASLNRSTRRYIHALALTEPSGIAEKLEAYLFPDNKKVWKERINSVIKRIPKRVIVMIDDLDRLEVDEIKEVCKLIVGNADFENLVFISAFDRSYVKKVFKEDVTIRNSFIDKFFSVQYSLPLRPYNIFYKYIKKELEHKLFEDLLRKQTLSQLDKYRSLYHRCIHNMRDAKRYVNLLLMSYPAVKNELDFIDFALVKLLLFVDEDMHTEIFARQMKKVNGRFVYEKQDKDRWSDLLKILFPERKNLEVGDYRRIFAVDSFHCYFHQRTYINADRRTIENTLIRCVDNNTSSLEILNIKQEEKDDYIFYLSTSDFYHFTKKDYFLNYVRMLFCAEQYFEHPKLRDTIYRVLDPETCARLNNCYKFDGNEFHDVAVEAIKEFVGKKAELAGDLIWTVRKWEEEAESLDQKYLGVVSSSDILHANIKILERIIESKYCGSELMFKIMHACVEDIDPHSKHTIRPERVYNLARQGIEKEPEYFISTFVRLMAQSSDPGWNEIGPYPLWKKIFGKEENMENFIFSDKLDNISKISCVRNFWRLFKENHYESLSFHIKGSVQELIDDDLERLLAELEKLNRLKEEYELFEKNDTDLLEQKGSIQKIKKEVDSLILNIWPKNDLLMKVENRLHEIYKSLNQV